MSQFSRDPRGPREYSSPQIRIRSAGDYRRYTGERLRLPNERQWFGPRIRRAIGGLFALAIFAAIGVAAYFGVTELVTNDDPSITPDTQAEVATETDSTDTTSEESATANAEADAATESDAESDEPTQAAAESAHSEPDSTGQADQAAAGDDQSASAQQPALAETLPVSEVSPSVAEQAVTPAQIGGAEIAAERATAEPIPSGIPRQLADGVDYDPTDPATVFTSRWPVGTTLRLTRLAGATLLTDEEQATVVGTETLVVVRGTESSNTDLQLSPAAFDLIAVYGTERIIAVSVEVTAAPPTN